MEEVNNLTFVGEVDYGVLPQVLALAQNKEARRHRTEIWVSGPGGDFPLTCGIIQLLKPLPRATLAFGEVCSASVLLAMAAPKGQRCALPGTLYGLHEPYVTDEVEDPASARSIEDLNKRMRATFYDLLYEYTGRQWKRRLKGQSMLWLSAEEAKSLGLVDHIDFLRL